MSDDKVKTFNESTYANITVMSDAEHEAHRKAERDRIYAKYGSRIDKILANHGGSIDNVLAPNVLKYVRDAMECYAVDKLIADDPLTKEYFWACVLNQCDWLTMGGSSSKAFFGQGPTDPISERERELSVDVAHELSPLIDSYAEQQIESLIWGGARIARKSIDAGYFVLRDCTLREYNAGCRSRCESDRAERRCARSRSDSWPIAIPLAVGLIALLFLLIRSLA